MLSRRRALTAAAALPLAAVAACRARPSSVLRRPRPDADAALLAAARTDEVALLSAYDRVLGVQPQLRAALAPLRAHHARHLAALGVAASPSPSPSLPARPGLASAETGSADPRQLRTAELAAAVARRSAADAATPRRAGLLASIGASEASHAAVLPALLR